MVKKKKDDGDVTFWGAVGVIAGLLFLGLPIIHLYITYWVFPILEFLVRIYFRYLAP